MQIVATDIHQQERGQLTELERSLLEKLCDGLSYTQIDRALDLPPGHAHKRVRKKLFRKIGTRTRHEAVATVAPTRSISQSDLQQALTGASFSLTPREIDVLLLMLQAPDFNRRQMAARLGIKESTVRTTINHINKKLHVTSRAGAVSLVSKILQSAKGSSHDH